MASAEPFERPASSTKAGASRGSGSGSGGVQPLTAEALAKMEEQEEAHEAANEAGPVAMN